MPRRSTRRHALPCSAVPQPAVLYPSSPSHTHMHLCLCTLQISFGQEQAACCLLKYRNTCILLDCALGLHSSLHARPKMDAAAAAGVHDRHTVKTSMPPILGPLIQVSAL